MTTNLDCVNVKHKCVNLDSFLYWYLIWFQLAKLSDKDIIEMIFFPVVNEACRVYAEGIAVKAADLDIAGVMGMGFPPYRYHILPIIKTWFI